MSNNTVFEGIEKSREARFKLDEEQHFKAVARRNKLLGLWAADKMGLADGEAEEYAKTVVVADLEEPGDEDVVRKVFADFEERRISISADQIRSQLPIHYAKAAKELAGEYPEPLGRDHEGVLD